MYGMSFGSGVVILNFYFIFLMIFKGGGVKMMDLGVCLGIE